MCLSYIKYETYGFWNNGHASKVRKKQYPTLHMCVEHELSLLKKLDLNGDKSLAGVPLDTQGGNGRSNMVVDNLVPFLKNLTSDQVSICTFDCHYPCLRNPLGF